MEYMIDSADLKEIKRINEFYPIAGVTTNPLILSRCGIDVVSAVKGIREIIGNKMLHVQVISEDFDGIVSDAEKLVKLGGENTFIKIPVTENGMKAIKYLSAKGYNITATAIFTPQQALLAASAGAKYVAPYVNRLDNIAINGVEIAANIHRLLTEAQVDCKVLAASFSNVEQIHMVSMKGIQSLTIPVNLFPKMIYHPLTDRAINEFVQEGKKYYNI